MNGNRAADAGQLVAAARWALSRAWQEHRGLYLALIGMTLLRGLTPPAVAIVIRGLVNAAVSTARAIAARTGTESLISRLPRGYDTMIGRIFGDQELSGGEWQQVAVARAMARDAALLILDEPTAQLDARREYELFRRFRELAHGRTTLLVSHRFTTVSLAHRILVLDGGRIVESGTHEELLARDGPYARLYALYQEQAMGNGRR